MDGGETFPFPGMVESSQLMVPQREVAVAPFDIGAGALEHLRERGCVRLELVLLRRTQLTECSTGLKQRGAKALGQRTPRLARCHRPGRGHPIEIICWNKTCMHGEGLRRCQHQLLDLLAYIP